MKLSISSRGRPYNRLGKGSNLPGSTEPSSTLTFLRGWNPYSFTSCTVLFSIRSRDSRVKGFTWVLKPFPPPPGMAPPPGLGPAVLADGPGLEVAEVAGISRHIVTVCFGWCRGSNWLRNVCCIGTARLDAVARIDATRYDPSAVVLRRNSSGIRHTPPCNVNRIKSMSYHFRRESYSVHHVPKPHNKIIITQKSESTYASLKQTYWQAGNRMLLGISDWWRSKL